MLASFDNNECLVYDGDYTPEYIEQQICGYSLFSDSKVVIIKSIDSFDASAATSNKRWIEMLNRVPEGHLVIIDGVSPTSKPVLYKHVKKIGKVFDFPQYLKKEDVLGWFSTQMAEAEKECEDGCFDIMIENIGEEPDGSGYDVDKLYMYIKKLLDYVGNRKNIDKFDIIKTCDGSGTFIIWNLFEAIDKRDYAKCVKLINTMVDMSKTSQDAVEYVFSMSLWRYRLLLMAKEFKYQKLSNEEISVRILGLTKAKRTGNGGGAVFEQDKDNILGE